MRKKLVLVLVLVFLASNAFAAEKKYNILKEVLETAVSPIETILGPVVELGQIVVTPSRVKEKLSSSSVSVSVINDSDIDRKKIDTVKEALKDEVGIDIRQTGAFQGQTSLFMRGGNSNQALLLVDGVKLYDPVSTGGQRPPHRGGDLLRRRNKGLLERRAKRRRHERSRDALHRSL